MAQDRGNRGVRLIGRSTPERLRSLAERLKESPRDRESIAMALEVLADEIAGEENASAAPHGRITGHAYGDKTRGLTVFRIDPEGAAEFMIFNGTASQRLRMPLAEARGAAADLANLFHAEEGGG